MAAFKLVVGVVLAVLLSTSALELPKKETLIAEAEDISGRKFSNEVFYSIKGKRKPSRDSSRRDKKSRDRSDSRDSLRDISASLLGSKLPVFNSEELDYYRFESETCQGELRECMETNSKGRRELKECEEIGVRNKRALKECEERESKKCSEHSNEQKVELKGCKDQLRSGKTYVKLTTERNAMLQDGLTLCVAERSKYKNEIAAAIAERDRYKAELDVRVAEDCDSKVGALPLVSFPSVNNRVYFYSKCLKHTAAEPAVSWYDAKATCEGYGMKLAIVDSNDLAELIFQHSNFEYSGIWCGANDLETEGRIIWDAGNAEVNITDLRSAKNDNKLDCFAISEAPRFLGLPCDKALPYICEVSKFCSVHVKSDPFP